MGIPELLTFITAAAPISEIRGAIPLALGFHLPPTHAFGWALAGNFLVTIPLYIVLRYGSDWLRARSAYFDRFFVWLFSRTRERHSAKFSLETSHFLRALALCIFVAIPLPLTGAWTGVLAAFLFGIPPRYAFPAIFLGIAIAGGIVLAISLGVISIF